MNDNVRSDTIAFNADLDRLTGLCVRIQFMAKLQRIEIEAAAHQAVALGLFSIQDYETIRLAFLGGLHGADNLTVRSRLINDQRRGRQQIALR